MDEPAGRLTFRIGDAFPADDELARHIVRLSMALGDLRIVGRYIIEENLAPHEQLYFVRLLASHMRELTSILNPRGQSVLPLPEVLASVGGAKVDNLRRQMRASHGEAMRLLSGQMALRPGVRLRDELRRLRNGFAHYHAHPDSDSALRDAIADAADLDGLYTVQPGDARASYADEIANQLVHPFGEAENAPQLVEELHDQLVGLLKPLGDLPTRG